MGTPPQRQKKKEKRIRRATKISDLIDVFIHDIKKLDIMEEYNTIAKLINGNLLKTSYKWEGNHYKELIIALNKEGWGTNHQKQDDLPIIHNKIMDKNLIKNNININISISNYTHINTNVIVTKLEKQE